MSLCSVSIAGFRAFADTGEINVGPITGIVGRNDCGKSAILHALRTFFDPPKKGIALTDVHLKDKAGEAVVELAFQPALLSTQRLRIDAKNEIDLLEDKLVAADGLLRVRLRLSAEGESHFELKVEDVDDPELFPLAMRKHDELLTLLESRGLPAVKAGKETNQQKRAALRAFSTQAGGGAKEEWVNAASIEKQIRALLPTFVYFSDTARFGIDETPVQNQFKSIVDKAVAAHAEALSIEQAIRNSVQAEFNKVFSRLQRLTPNVSAITANTRVSWKKAVDSIDLSWTDQFGMELPYEMRGAGIRRLFMVAYFQYLTADGMHDSGGQRYLFAIEEPELHLHPGAQRDLISALKELGELGHTVLFTTHSPVFASAPPKETLVLVRRDAAAAEALSYPQYDVNQLAHELGVEASDRLVGKNHVVLVEGSGDVEFYSYVLAELNHAGLTTLDPAKVLFLQCGGMSNLQFVATTQCVSDAGLKWAILMDSDRTHAGAAISPVALSLQSSPPPSCLAVRVLDRSYIENYLDASAVSAELGISCVINHFGKATSLAGSALSKGDWSRIKRAVAAIARRMGGSNIIAAARRSDGTCEWVDHFESIRVSFGL